MVNISNNSGIVFSVHEDFYHIENVKIKDKIIRCAVITLDNLDNNVYIVNPVVKNERGDIIA